MLTDREAYAELMRMQLEREGTEELVGFGREYMAVTEADVRLWLKEHPEAGDRIGSEWFGRQMMKRMDDLKKQHECRTSLIKLT